MDGLPTYDNVLADRDGNGVPDCYETNLPPGFEAKMHNGRPYWLNHNDQTSTWTDPRINMGGGEGDGSGSPYNNPYDSEKDLRNQYGSEYQTQQPQSLYRQATNFHTVEGGYNQTLIKKWACFICGFVTFVVVMIIIFSNNSGSGGYYCFAQGTLVQMADESWKPIQNIIIGDTVKVGGKVLGVMTFSGVGETLFDYHGIAVTGVHPVLENGIWKRVKDTGVPKLSYEEDIIYDLVNENNRMVIMDGSGNEHLFTDFAETPVLPQIENLELNYLNNVESSLWNTAQMKLRTLFQSLSL